MQAVEEIHGANVSKIFRKFIPLHNFIPGNNKDYRNTCFIASALNLASWIPAIAEGLVDAPIMNNNWDEGQWRAVITKVRRLDNAKYKWEPHVPFCP